jgi:prepilin-type N-terminal cleavage/methylation domain-containing protein
MQSVKEYTDRRPGLTLVEILVVVAIAAILLGLLLPAVQYAREASRRTQCQSNLNQLGIALGQFVNARGRLPNPPAAGTISGWAIDILPFIEEASLADQLAGSPALSSAMAIAAAQNRPPIMRCPSGYDGDSTLATVAVSHYAASFNRTLKAQLSHWRIADIPTDSRSPWVVSPEIFLVGPAALAPHNGDYNTASGIGGDLEWLGDLEGTAD